MISCSYQLTERAPWPDPLRFLADAGFPLVNVPMGAGGVFRLARDKEVARLRGDLAAFGLGVDWVHAPYGEFAATVAEDAEERAIALASHSFFLEQSARLGARAVVFHPFWGRTLPPEVSRGRAVERLVDAFGQWVERGEALGVAVCLENMTAEGTNQCTEAVFAAVPGLRLCFDAGHAELAGNAERWLPAMAGRVGATHLHDNFGRTLPGGGVDYDRHLIPGWGCVDWRKVKEGLDRSGYTGPYGLELHAVEDGEAAARTAYAAGMAIARGEAPPRGA